MSCNHFLKEKQDFDLDAPETTLLHRDLVLKKQFLKKLYEEWYGTFIDKLNKLPEGKIIEIGAGGSFLKQLRPDVITSDILPLPNCDMTFSAENIPFPDQSVSAIFMMDVLHHIPHAQDFFKEAQRVLVNGGMIFMIEPADTIFSRFIYTHFHHEPFDPKVKEWSFPSSGPLSGANGALPSIIFRRDLDKFELLFPSLKLKSIRFHTPFRYLLTGGLSYKSMVPGWSFKLVTIFEKLFTPVFPLTAMFQTIEISKSKDQ